MGKMKNQTYVKTFFSHLTFSVMMGFLTYVVEQCCLIFHKKKQHNIFTETNATAVWH